MKLTEQLIEAYFVKRINRFSAVARLRKKDVTVFLPNPARLDELLTENARMILAKRPGRARRTHYDVAAVYDRERPVSIDTRVANRLFREAVEEGRLEAFRGYEVARVEPMYRKVRFDFYLERPGDRAFVEVKSCSLVADGVALFPDVPTQRGRRHTMALAQAVQDGYRGYMVWVVQREDASRLRPIER